MDYVDGSLMLVVKDDEWNDEQIAVSKEPFEIACGFTNGLMIFLAEGGPLDACDFYFNVQECDEKEELLKADKIHVSLVLLDKDDTVRVWKKKLLGTDLTGQLQEMLKKQNEWEFMPGEFDVNAQGLMDSMDPAEMGRFISMKFSVK